MVVSKSFLDSTRRMVESWVFAKRGIVRLAASGGWNVIVRQMRRCCDWLAAAEEILLRNQVPFGYVIAENGRELAIPNACELLVVANQVCLSDAQIAAIVAYAKRGGKLVVTGDTGRHDEWNAQRLENPLKPQLAGEICDKVKVLPFFEKYLKCGYYPMYRDVSSQFRSDQGQTRQLRRQRRN